MLIVKAFAVDIVAINELGRNLSNCFVVVVVLRPIVVWAFSIDGISIFPCVTITVITLDTLPILGAPCFTVVIHSDTLILLSVVV